jgi:ABC-type sugar transport system ATPase subunit
MRADAITIARKAIVLENVTKSFGTHTAVANLNLEIAHGEFISIIGPSGCGKTTTLLLIAGLDRPTTGAIYIDGRRVNDVKPWKRHTPLVWQNFALFPHLKATGRSPDSLAANSNASVSLGRS